MNRLLRLTFLFVLLSLSSTISLQAQSSLDDTARLRIGHFSPNLGPVDVYINGERLLADFSFPDLTEWLVYNDTNITLTFTSPEASIDEAVIPDYELTLSPGQWITATLIGDVQNDSLMVHLLEEDFSPIPQGEARITVFNAITQGNPLSFFAGEAELIAGLAYPYTQGDNDGAISVDIVASRFDLTVQETNNSDNVIFTSRRTTLGANRHYFIAAVGIRTRADGIFVTTEVEQFTEAPPTSGLETVDIGQGPAYLRVGHFSPDGTPLELYIDGEKADDISTVSYPSLSNWIQIDAGVYEISLAPEGTSSQEAVVGPFDAAIIGSQWQTLAVIGYQQTDSLIARILKEDYSPIPQGESRLTFMNAIPDVPPVDIVINDQVFFGALTFPGLTPTAETGTDSVTVAARRIDIEITESGNINNSYLELFDVPLSAGNHYFIAAIRGGEGIEYYLQPITQKDVVESFSG